MCPRHEIRDRRKTRAHGDLLGGDTVVSSSMSCASWRLGVEANNIRDWYSIGYMSNYMFGDQLRQDCAVLAREAVAYAEGLELADDGRDVWSTLTNLPYYADTGFGYVRDRGVRSFACDRASSERVQTDMSIFNYRHESLDICDCMAEPYNVAYYFDEHVANATAPPREAAGYGHQSREATIKNLRSAGYHTWDWEMLVLKCAVVAGFFGVVWCRTSPASGRTKLVDAGYRIVGNMGDQWSDLVDALGGRPHLQGALPDPMYYSRFTVAGVHWTFLIAASVSPRRRCSCLHPTAALPLHSDQIPSRRPWPCQFLIPRVGLTTRRAKLDARVRPCMLPPAALSPVAAGLMTRM
nr:unnamed protein product [Digitaria exilis]